MSLPPYFEVNGTAIAYTAPCNGDSEEAGYTFGGETKLKNAEVSEQTVSVSGFDFAQDYVYKDGDGNYHGKQLVLRIPIKVKEGFWGGNDVPTNENDQSGIFKPEKDGGDRVKPFDGSPKADVPLLNFDIVAKDNNIYYGGTIPTVDQMWDNTQIIVNGEQKSLSSFTWEDDYAELDGSAAKVSESVSNIADRHYQVTGVVVKSKTTKNNGNDSTPAAFQKDDTADVNVFTPTIHFHDMRTYMTKTADVRNHAYDKVEWLHGTTKAAEVTMVGTVPNVTCEISDRVTLENNVENPGVRDYFGTVTKVTINGLELATRGNDGKRINDDVVKFFHEACDDIYTNVTWKDAPGEFMVHVFKPVVTFQDLTTYKGTEATQDSCNSAFKSPVSWTHPHHVSGKTLVLPEGVELPQVTFTYTPDAAKLYTEGGKSYFVKDVPVNVTVLLDGKDKYIPVGMTDEHAMNDYVNFQWVENQSSVGCSNSCAKPDDANFTVHVLPCELTVKKAVTSSLYGENDTFVFHVQADPAKAEENNTLAKQVNLTIVLGGKSQEGGKYGNHTLSTSQKITGLPVGYYIVTEDTGWSWRYNPVGDSSQTREIKGGETEPIVVTITNTQKSDNKWLSSEDFKVNTFNPIGNAYSVTYATVPPEEETGKE